MGIQGKMLVLNIYFEIYHKITIVTDWSDIKSLTPPKAELPVTSGPLVRLALNEILRPTPEGIAWHGI